MGSNPLSPGWGGQLIPEDVSSQRDAQIEAKANAALQAAHGGSSTAGTSSQVGPCAGGGIEGSNGFIIARTVNNKPNKIGEFDTMCFAQVPSSTNYFHVEIGKTADSTVKSATITRTLTPTPQEVAGNHAEIVFNHPLEFNTQYGAIRIKAFDSAGNLAGVFPTANPWNGTNYTYFDQWTTGNAIGAPSAPDCRLDPTGLNGNIISNIISVDADGDVGAVTFRIYADPTHNLSFNDQQAVRAIGYFNPVLGGTIDTHTIHIPATIQDPTQKFIDIQGQFVLGQTVQWTQNALAHGTGRGLSATSTCTFIAGAVNTDAGAFASMCAGCTLSFSPIDGRQTLVTVQFTQPTPPFAIKKVRLDRSDGAGFNPEFPADRPIASGTISSGLQTLTYIVKTKVATNHTWRMFFLGRPGLSGTSPIFNSSGLADPTGDLGQAGAVQNLALHWTAKKGYKATWQRPATNRASVQYYNVYFTNGFQNAFMCAFDGQQAGFLAGQDITAFGQAGATFQVKDTVWATHQRLANTAATFTNIFPNVGACVSVTPVNLVNGVETLGPPTLACISGAEKTRDMLNSTDAVNTIDVSTTLWSPTQLIPNGDFLNSDGAGNVNFWQANGASINTGTSPASWSPSNHSLSLTGSGTLTVAQKKHLVPGDVFSLSFLISGSGSGTMSLNISDIGVTQSPVISITANGNQVLYGGVMTLNSSNTGSNQFVQLIWNTSGTWVLDRVMMTRGKQPVAFMPRTAAFEGDAGSFANENPFNAAVGAATQQDLSTPTGASDPTQGRYFPIGSGGNIPVL